MGKQGNKVNQGKTRIISANPSKGEEHVGKPMKTKENQWNTTKK